MTGEQFRNLLLTAQMQARLAAAVYAGRGAITDLAADVDARNFRYVESHNCTAAVLVFADHVHVSIGGSDDRYDWLTNLSASQRWTPEGLQVHAGYGQAAEYLGTALRRANVDTFCVGRKLVLGGHSAGGSIAQLVAMAPAFEPREVITLGSPRVMSPVSAAMYRSQPWEVYQFTADGDPVPRMPLRRFRRLFGSAEYANTESPLVLRADGSVVTDRESGSVSRLVRLSKSWLFSGSMAMGLMGVCDSMVKAHSIANYQALIEKALTRGTDA